MYPATLLIAADVWQLVQEKEDGVVPDVHSCSHFICHFQLPMGCNCRAMCFLCFLTMFHLACALLSSMRCDADVTYPLVLVQPIPYVANAQTEPQVGLHRISMHVHDVFG